MASIKDLLGGKKSSVRKIASELRVLGKKCNTIHAMLANAMADRLLEPRAGDFVYKDVASDILMMVTDVKKYNPTVANEFIDLAKRLQS